MPNLETLTRHWSRVVWEIDPVGLPPWRRWPVRLARLGQLMVRDLLDGQLNLQAMSLVYTTLLSLVPLLAVSFSVLKAFEVHNQIEPFLSNFMEPLGEKGPEITAQVLGFVDNMKVGVLGAVGLGMLLYTVVSLIQKIEQAFNYTWHVSRPRPFAQRFSDYLSVILIGPVLVFSALGATASIMSNALVQRLMALPGLAWAVEGSGALVPYLLVITAFTFVYLFVPNTRVRFGSALVGAVVAGGLWQTVGWGFAAFVVGSTKYAAIYSGFAILIIFMIWLYLAWLILLVGASIAFYHQHPEYLSVPRRDMRLSHRARERLALACLYLIARSHYRQGPAWTLEGLSCRLGLPGDNVAAALAPLERAGLLVLTGDDPPAYLPGRAPETLAVSELLAVVRTAEDALFPGPRPLAGDDPVARVMDRVDRALEAELAGLSLRDLALQGPPDAA